MDSDIFSKTWHNYKNRASAGDNDWDTERGLNNQYEKMSSLEKHPDREQRSYSIDHSTDSQPQREPVNILPGQDINALNPDNIHNQDSALGIGSDDMVSRHQKINDPRNKVQTVFRPPPPSTRKSISENSGIDFFGDSNQENYKPRSRTSLDQESLHRGYVSTLPSALGRDRRRTSTQTQGAPLADITNIASNPRDESVSTSAYSNVPIGPAALKQNNAKLSTGSSSDDYNSFLSDRNDMSKNSSYYRSTTENRNDLSSSSFDTDPETNIPYSARNLPSSFPSDRTEYAIKPKETLDIATGDSSHDKDTLGKYAVNTHEKTAVLSGPSDIKAHDKKIDQLKDYQTDDSSTEDEDESGGKGFFSYATSAAAAVGAGAAAAGAVVSNVFFGKNDDNKAIDTQRSTTGNQHFSLDNSPSVWTSEDLSSDNSHLYGGTPIRWGQSSSSKTDNDQRLPDYADRTYSLSGAKPTGNNFGANQVDSLSAPGKLDTTTNGLSSSLPAPKVQEENIPHRAYVLPVHESVISHDDSRLPSLPVHSIDKQSPSRSYDLPIQESAPLKNTDLPYKVPIAELAKEGSTTCVSKSLPRPKESTVKSVNLVGSVPSEPAENENLPYQAYDVPTREQVMLKDAILTPPLAPAKPVETEHVPYQAYDVPTREQAMLKDAIITPPPNEPSQSEIQEDSPYDVPTKGQAVLEKSLSDTPPPQELKNVSGLLPNQQIYTSMPLPDPLKLDQKKPVPQPIRLESIEGDTREKPVPLLYNAVPSDRMPGSFERHPISQSISSDPVSNVQHLNEEVEPAIHGQHACYHTKDTVHPEITPQQVNHKFCGNVKEPSLHGQNPSFYPGESANASGINMDKSLNQENANIDNTFDKSSRPSSSLNQNQSPIGSALPVVVPLPSSTLNQNKSAIDNGFSSASSRPLDPINQDKSVIDNGISSASSLPSNNLNKEKSAIDNGISSASSRPLDPISLNTSPNKVHMSDVSSGPSGSLDQDNSPIDSFTSNSMSRPSGTLNQDKAPISSTLPSKGLTRELGSETSAPVNQGVSQGINHDGVTYRDFASQGAYDPAISKLNTNVPNNKGKQVADLSAVEHDIYGNPLRDIEQSKAPLSPLRPEDMSQAIPKPQESSTGSYGNNGYILGGQTPSGTDGQTNQSRNYSAKSAAGAAAAVGASVGASKLFSRGKKNQVAPVSGSYKIDADTQKLEPIPPIALRDLKKPNDMAGFNNLEKESNESVSSTRATTGKIIPDAVYIKRDEDEVKSRAAYTEDLSNSGSKPIVSTHPVVVEEDSEAVNPTFVSTTHAAKVPDSKDYLARINETGVTGVAGDPATRPGQNVRRKSKGSIVMDKLRRFSMGRKSSSSSDDAILDATERRPSAAEIYKNQHLKSQADNANKSLSINTGKVQTNTVSPLTTTTGAEYTSGLSTKPINIANEVPYYVDDPRISTNGVTQSQQINSSQKIAKVPGINTMRIAGTKPVKAGQTVFVRLDENHTTPQIRQVVLTEAAPLASISNIEQGVPQNMTTGTTGFVPGSTSGINDNVSFGTYISGHLENRRGSIQKTVGKLVNNEEMQERGDLKKVSGKIKIKAYQDNRRSSSGSQ